MERIVSLRRFLEQNFELNVDEVKDLYILHNAFESFPCVKEKENSLPWNEYELVLRKYLNQKLYDRKEKPQSNLNKLQITKVSDLLAFNIWEKIYDAVGKDICDYIFKTCHLMYKLKNGTFISLKTDKGIEEEKRKPWVKGISQFKSCNNKHFGYKKNIIVKRGKMLYSTLMRVEWPKKSVLSKRPLSPKILLDAIKKKEVGCAVLINPSSLVTEALLKFIRLHTANRPYRKILFKLLTKDSTISTDGVVRVKTSTVVKFIQKVILTCVPKILLGGTDGLNKFITNIEHLITPGLKQSISLDQLMEGVCPVNLEKERCFISKIALWLVEDYIIDIIRLNFYVSECAKSSEINFYMQNTWCSWEKMITRKMVEKGDLEHVKEPQTNDVYVMRLIQKNEGGFRPIIRLRKPRDDYILMSQALLKQFVVQRNDGLFPNTIKDLHTNWSRLSSYGKGKQYYYIKVDIKDAFGSIKHDKLKEILNECFNKYTTSQMEVKTFKFKDFLGYEKSIYQFTKLEPCLPKKIVREDFRMRQVLDISKLKEYILSYCDKIYLSLRRGPKIYKLKRGLPQGGHLSPVLCELYYNELDRNYLKHLCYPEDLLLRAVDDYIYVSQNQERSQNFLKRMDEHFSEFGVVRQDEKTLTNVETDKPSKDNVPFFGFYFNIKNLSVSANLECYRNKNFISTLTVRHERKMFLSSRMNSTIGLKLCPLLLESRYNSKIIIYGNVFSSACVMALRYDAIVRKLLSETDKEDDAFLLQCAKNAISLLASTSTKISYRSKKEGIQFTTARYLAYRAFVLVLKPYDHYPVHRQLSLEASRVFLKLGARDKKLVRKIHKKLPSPLETCLID